MEATGPNPTPFSPQAVLSFVVAEEAHNAMEC